MRARMEAERKRQNSGAAQAALPDVTISAVIIGIANVYWRNSVSKTATSARLAAACIMPSLRSPAGAQQNRSRRSTPTTSRR